MFDQDDEGAEFALRAFVILPSAATIAGRGSYQSG